MLDGVVERLEGGPVEVFLDVRVQARGGCGGGDGDRDLLTGRQGGRLPRQGRDEPLLRQRTWAQLEDEGPHLGQRSSGQRLQLADLRLRRMICAQACSGEVTGE